MHGFRFVTPSFVNDIPSNKRFKNGDSLTECVHRNLYVQCSVRYHSADQSNDSLFRRKCRCLIKYVEVYLISLMKKTVSWQCVDELLNNCLM